MEKRLRIAKELLTEEGVIFISIDDNEHAQLKLLCDEVFGGENFVSSICVELSKTQGMKVKSAQEGRIVKNHEYIFIYSKNIEKIYIDRKPLYEKTDIWDNHFNKIILNLDNKYYIYTIDEYIKNNNEKIFKLFQKYNILDNEKITNNSIRKGILINEEIQKYFYNDISDIIYQEMACSIAIPEYIIEKLEKEKILKYEKYLLTTTSSGKIRQLRSLKENINFSDDYDPKLQRVTIRGALWKDFYSDMMNIQKEGKMDFKNGKKPIRLIKQLNKWFNRKNSIVLDFFAGSGTTGHAVVQLNKEDCGNRKYILCTNNENNICEDVTYKRLSNIQEELPHNLKYYKVDYVSKSDEEVYEKLNEHIQEMVNLEEGKEVKVIYDEEEVEKVLEESACDSSVYIMGGIMLSGKEQKIVEKKRIKIKEVPEIYYRNELKELGEI